MKFTHRYAMPSHYHVDNLRDDAKQINSIIENDEDSFDMRCHAHMGELVFEGFCEVEELATVARHCDEMIFEVTDERGE